MAKTRRRQTAQAVSACTVAKVVLVGEGGIGKSELGRRLASGGSRRAGRQYLEQVWSPPGRQYQEQVWSLPGLCATRADGTRCEAVLWKPEGFPDYRLIQPLLLGDADVALMLFDPTLRG